MSSSVTAKWDSTEFIINDAIVITMNEQRQVYKTGFLWVKDGNILEVGDSAALKGVPENVLVRSASGRLIMPGLVNAHGHLSNGILRGIYDEMPLSVWFSRGMWPVLDSLDRKAGQAGAELALVELMTMGVTTSVSAEFGHPNADLPDGVLDAIKTSGIRAVVSRMTVDSHDDESESQAVPKKYRETPQRAADQVRRLQKAYNSALISVAPEALGVLRCTPDMVQTMHAVAVETGSHFLMHAASSKEEHTESLRRFGHGGIEELKNMGVLGPKTLLAHVIWLDEREINHLADNQTGISHNPVANAYYASGIAPLAEFLEAGVRVGLGVDGASTNNGQNLWETMKAALLFQKERLSSASFGSAELALELATLGGARALHMEDQIGSLEPGKRADFIVIDTERVALSPPQTVVSNLVYSNDPGAVRDVFVNGEAVVVDGEHQRRAKDDVIAASREASHKLLQRTGLDKYLQSHRNWKWQ